MSCRAVCLCVAVGLACAEAFMGPAPNALRTSRMHTCTSSFTAAAAAKIPLQQQHSHRTSSCRQRSQHLHMLGMWHKQRSSNTGRVDMRTQQSLQQRLQTLQRRVHSARATVQKVLKRTRKTLCMTLVSLFAAVMLLSPGSASAATLAPRAEVDYGYTHVSEPMTEVQERFVLQEDWALRQKLHAVMRDPSIDHDNYRMPGDEKLLKDNILFSDALSSDFFEDVILQKEISDYKLAPAQAARDRKHNLMIAGSVVGTFVILRATAYIGDRMSDAADKEEAELYGGTVQVDATELPDEGVQLSELDGDDDVDYSNSGNTQSSSGGSMQSSEFDMRDSNMQYRMNEMSETNEPARPDNQDDEDLL